MDMLLCSAVYLPKGIDELHLLVVVDSMGCLRDLPAPFVVKVFCQSTTLQLPVLVRDLEVLAKQTVEQWILLLSGKNQ